MRRSHLINLGISLASVLLLVMVCELGFRLYLAAFGSHRQQMMYLYSVEDLAAETELLAGAPYVNYIPSPIHPDHNSLGYRGTEIRREKPAGVFRIVSLGGSTTYGTYLPSASMAYPAQLEVVLREAYGYENVQVINAGVPAYKTWEILVNFAFRVLDLEPDLIIVYEAVNDVAARLVDPAYYTGENAGAGIWQFRLEPLPPSALYRFLAIRLGWMNDPRRIELRLRSAVDIPFCEVVIQNEVEWCGNFNLPVTELLARNPPIYFERNLRNLIALAAANDVQVMFSTWAYAPQPFDHVGGDHMTFAFRQQAVAEHNDIVRALATAYDLPLIDFAETMPDDDYLWIDGLHVSEAGAQEQARQYAAFIHANSLIVAP